MKVKLLAVPLLLCCAQVVRGQCTGYSANVQQVALSPADAAQRGQVTVTVTGQAADSSGNPLSGSAPSHNLTVTPGTRVNLSWTSNNAVSAVNWFTINGGPPQNKHSVPVNSNSGYWAFNNSNVGNKYTLYVQSTDSSGNTTTDRVPIAVVAGSGPSIVSQDGMFTNIYVEVTITFGGGSMLNNCSACQGGEIQHCINATHTPYVTMTAVNSTSGESQSLARQQAGNVAKSNESVSGSGSILISGLPDDTVDGTANGEIFCTMFGDLPVNNNDDWHIQWEWAWTKVSTIQSTCVTVPQMGGGVRCQVTSQYTCSQKSSPADLRPFTVYSDFPVGTPPAPVTPATMPPFWWTWSIGIRPRITGVPWIFPFSDLGAILQKDYWVVKILSGAFTTNSTIRDCTNFDKGTVPSPWPPFDQP